MSTVSTDQTLSDKPTESIEDKTNEVKSTDSKEQSSEQIPSEEKTKTPQPSEVFEPRETPEPSESREANEAPEPSEAHVTSETRERSATPETDESCEPREPYDTLVLSGGGVKGIHILGAIQALMDMSMLTEVKNYLGTSIGAIIGYCLAIGYTPLEIIISLHANRWLEKVQSFNLVAMINGEGATSFISLYEALEKMTLLKIGKLLTLGKLKEEYGKTLVCATYNITTCKVEYLSPDTHPDLPCLIALRMSANVPLVFERFRYMGSFYVDGGIGDNFPITPALEIGKNIIGLYLEVPADTLRDEPGDGILAYFLRIIQIPIIQCTKANSEKAKGRDSCTIIPIHTPDFRNALQFDVQSKSRLDMFSNGYSCVKKFFHKEDIDGS